MGVGLGGTGAVTTVTFQSFSEINVVTFITFPVISVTQQLLERYPLFVLVDGLRAEVLRTVGPRTVGELPLFGETPIAIIVIVVIVGVVAVV